MSSQRKSREAADTRRPRGRQTLPTGTAKTFAGVAGAVQALYEKYPYPQYQRLFVCPDEADSLAYLAHRCYRPEPFRPRRILVAGCGTTQVVSVAAEYPSAKVMGVDISRRSLEIAGGLAQDLGLKNLTLHHEDLLTFSGHDGEFNLIECYGVLHHTADPLLGLRNLARALAPDGLMSVMVYSARVRQMIGEIRRIFEMLNAVRETRGGDPALEARRAFAVRLVRALAVSRSALAEAGRAALSRFEKDPTQFADAYLHPREVRYSLDEVLAMVAGAGLEMIGFVHEQEWDPAGYLEDPDLVARVRNLSREERWRFLDVVGSPFYHFLCAHPSAAGRAASRPCLTDDELLLSVVPRPCAVHGFPLQQFRVAGPALPEPHEGSTVVRWGPDHVRFRGTFGDLAAPAIALDYVRLADGRRTVREIAALATRGNGSGGPVGPAQVAGAFRALFGMIPHLAPDATQCQGCPLRPQEARGETTEETA